MCLFQLNMGEVMWPMLRFMCNLWRPVLVKIVIIKLPHKSVFSVTVVLFISLLYIFIGGTKYFLRRLLFIFSKVNYIISLVK